jgi:hypothetical protein
MSNSHADEKTSADRPQRHRAFERFHEIVMMFLERYGLAQVLIWLDFAEARLRLASERHRVRRKRELDSGQDAAISCSFRMVWLGLQRLRQQAPTFTLPTERDVRSAERRKDLSAAVPLCDERLKKVNRSRRFDFSEHRTEVPRKRVDVVTRQVAKVLFFQTDFAENDLSTRSALMSESTRRAASIYAKDLHEIFASVARATAVAAVHGVVCLTVRAERLRPARSPCKLA